MFLFSSPPPPLLVHAIYVYACHFSPPTRLCTTRPYTHTTGEARVTVPLVGRVVLLLSLARVRRVSRRPVMTRHSVTLQDRTGLDWTARDRLHGGFGLSLAVE